MKTHLFALFAFVLLATPPIAEGQQPQESGPVPVVITPTRLQYKVLDLGRIAPGTNMTGAETLERILNELAAQGWKVVTSSGASLILSRGV